MTQPNTNRQSARCKANTHSPVDIKHKAGKRMIFLMLGLALVIVAFFFMIYPAVMVGAPDDADIRIPRNATEQQVRDSLSKHLGESFTNKVFNLVHLRPTDFSRRHGLYHVFKGQNAMGVMRLITTGGQTPVRLTINGFRSLDLLTERISQRIDVHPDSIRALLRDPEFMAQYHLTPENAMALFLNDTYEIYWSATPREVLQKFGSVYNFFWNSHRVKTAHLLGLTPADVSIIASIVDEETNNLDEKGTIGRLYINRLAKGMPLQADPTIRFALNDFTIRRVRANDLRVESPYNTYTHRGLPPGPIRTTSMKTLAEVLESQPNNYLYMCAKAGFSGTHAFAETYDEHLKNAKLYQEFLDRKGIDR